MDAVTLAIDPGVHECACAVFEDGALIRATFARYGVAMQLALSTLDSVVVERPEYQGDRTRRARPQDLISLAWEGAKLAAAFAGAYDADLRELTPSQWKGQEPKPVHHARLWDVLTAAERVVLGGAATERTILDARRKGALDRWGKPGASYYPRKFTAHNLLDAAALGCYYLGRLRRT